MGKKSKKADAAKAIKLSKKDAKKREALKAREAEIAAELERRKAAKKSKGKKAKKAKRVDPIAAPVEDMGITASAEAPIVPESAAVEEIERAVDVAERIKPLKGKALKAAMQADTDAGKAKKAKLAARLATVAAEASTPEPAAADEESDEEIRARVQAKRAARAGSPERLADMVEKVAEGKKARKEAHAVTEAVIVEVETETGRVFEAGDSTPAETTVVEEEFAKPSEANGPTLEEGRNGYKIIQLGADGKPDPRKVRQMTRVTTFVGNIDDETKLREWEKRLLAEGLSAAADEFAPRVNDLVHRYSVKVSKARKADRKGKLGIGELARLEDDASREYKTALNAIVEEALEAAGRNEKAEAGTNLHALAEFADEHGIDAVRAKYDADEISATDLASIEAYVERMTRLGAKVIESEAVIVNDEMGYAGRLDRVVMAKLPELTIETPAGTWTRPADQRSRRYIADIKSGRIDYGAGKISRQLAAYGLGDLYDMETGERSRHSAARDIALVIHLPQGAGTCKVHAVDIKHGAALLKLSAEVRRARNTGKKTIDTSVDIADPEPGE